LVFTAGEKSETENEGGSSSLFGHYNKYKLINMPKLNNKHAQLCQIRDSPNIFQLKYLPYRKCSRRTFLTAWLT